PSSATRGDLEMTTRTSKQDLGRQLASLMRRRAAIGMTFSSGIVVIDLEHIRECGRPGNPLLETLITATHEFAHHSHPRWSEQRVEKWWTKNAEPKRQVLVEFVRGLE